MGVHLGPSFWSVRELKIKKMERAILFKVLVIIAVLAVHIEAAGHEQNGGGSNIRRPRPPRPSRPPQQPSTDQDQEQEHTHEEVEREESMEVSDPEHGGPDCPYKKKYKYKKKYGGYKKYGGGYKKKYGGYKKYDDYGYGGYKKYDDYGYGGYKKYGGQKYGGGYGLYGGQQYGGQQYGVYNQGYQKYGQNVYGTYGTTAGTYNINYTAPNTYVPQAPPQYNYQDIMNKGYKKAGDFAKAGETYKSENVRVSFSSEHVPGEFGFLEKFHYIKPTPYGHYAGMGRQHSYYDNGSNNRRYGQRYGGGYKKKYDDYGYGRYKKYDDDYGYGGYKKYDGEYEEKYYDEPKYEEKYYDEPKYEGYEGKYD